MDQASAAGCLCVCVCVEADNAARFDIDYSSAEEAVPQCNSARLNGPVTLL